MAEKSAASRLDPEHVPFDENNREITGRGEACEEGERVAQTIAQIPSPQSYWAQSWQGKGDQWLRAPASQKSPAAPGFDCSPGSRPSSSRSRRFRHGARSPLAFPLHLPAAAGRALVSSVCAPGTGRPYNSPCHPLAMPLPTAGPTAAPPPASTPTRPFFPER
jgi:hypothetical protein